MAEVVEPAPTDWPLARPPAVPVKTNGLRSDAGQAAYWRMQWESCQEALGEVLAENRENVEALRDVVVDNIGSCDAPETCDCSLARGYRLTAHMRPPATTPPPSASSPEGAAGTGGGS